MYKYKDIIGLPHHVSPTRPRMSLAQRAAQFAPFAALNGHEEAIAETARYTSAETELSDSEAEKLNRKLMYASRHGLSVILTYFRPDSDKAGGAYLHLQGVIKKIDTQERILTLTDGHTVSLDSIRAITLPPKP